MQVVKIVGWWCLLKQHALMVDPTFKRVGLSMDLVSLLLDLVMMEIVDLPMMSLNWEVPIKSTQDVGGRNCSVE